MHMILVPSGMPLELHQVLRYCSSLYLLALCLRYFMLKQPFTDHFPCTDIHEALSPDLLHQVIKGTLKDHLVEWVLQHIKQHHSAQEANDLIDELDHWYVFMFLPYYASRSSLSFRVSEPCQHFQVSGDSRRDAILSSGQAMIQKH